MRNPYSRYKIWWWISDAFRLFYIVLCSNYTAYSYIIYSILIYSYIKTKKITHCVLYSFYIFIFANYHERCQSFGVDCKLLSVGSFCWDQ